MTDHPPLDPTADDPKLLAQVVGYYHRTLKATPDALDYLRRRGIAGGRAIDQFRLGYSDRSLGTRLPGKETKAGAALRSRLQTLGLFRASGHEHFRGSLTVPVPAADGSGRVVDLYGRKTQGDKLRRGTPLHVHLADRRRGVWNVEGFGAAREVVLCRSPFDALTFWTHGYRNVTCTFGVVTADLMAAVQEFAVGRVLTTDDAAAEPLLAAGLEVFRVRLPPGVDANAFALATADPADALGSLLRHAEWVGRGAPPTAVPAAIPVTPADSPDDDTGDGGAAGTGDDTPREATTEPEPVPEPPTRTASPVPLPPADDDVTVTDAEVVMAFGTRRYRVRGLERNPAPEALRVNVRAGNGVGSFTDTLDLYSAKHRRAFVEQAAAELSVEGAVVKRDVGRLMLKLEDIRDARGRAAEPLAPARPDLTPAERDAALALLRDPALLDRIVADFGVVGEAANKLVGYLAAVSRKLDAPLAVIVQSASAAGKSTLMEAVLGFVPPEDVVKFSAMTGQSLYYLPPDALRHKILAIVEEEGAAKAAYALKLLQSEGELRIASTGKEASTGRLTTHEYRVEGPVMIFLTTTSIGVDEELLSRCLVLTVDEDREQTRAIHRLQRHRQTLAGLLAARRQADTLAVHRNAQRLLRPLLVANPYAERLTFMDAATRTRRDNQKYLTLIRTVALLRQHQRPVRTADCGGRPVEYIEVTLEDIEAANRLAADVLGRSLDDLPPQTRRLLDLIDAFVAAGCRGQGTDRADFRFTQRDVREATGWGNTQLKVHLKRLAEMEFLLAHRDRAAKRFVYELAYSPPAGGRGRVLAGLLDVDELRRERPGPGGQRSADGRGAVGPGSGGGPGPTDAPAPGETGT